MSDGRHIRLEGFTRVDRHEMIARLRDTFQTANADLTDHKLFSNTAISLSFEVRADHLAELGSALSATGLELDEESKEALAQDGTADEIASGALNVTFIHNEPELRIPVPPIPG